MEIFITTQNNSTTSLGKLLFTLKIYLKLPDLDFLGGPGNHRNMFFHSVISAAVLETMVYSSIDASNMIYKNLPEKHDEFWDNLVGYENWANAFVTGACTGIMYHLLIDGTLDGNKAMTNFPFSMSMEGHNAFFITNAIAEGLDLNKKGTHNNLTSPSMRTETKVTNGKLETIVYKDDEVINRYFN